MFLLASTPSIAFEGDSRGRMAIGVRPVQYLDNGQPSRSGAHLGDVWGMDLWPIPHLLPSTWCAPWDLNPEPAD